MCYRSCGVILFDLFLSGLVLSGPTILDIINERLVECVGVVLVVLGVGIELHFSYVGPTDP